MNYKQTLEYLIANTSLKEAKVFDYTGDAGEEYFQKLLNFTQVTLNTTHILEQILLT